MRRSSVRVVLSRTLDLVRSRQREARLRQEVQAHLEALTDQFVAQGLAPDAARDAARRAFGGVDQMTERYRDQRGWPVMTALAQDLRFGARLLMKDRYFTTAAIVVLALGIGVNTALFSIINAMNFSRLPVERPSQVMRLGTVDVKERNRGTGVSYPDFLDWRQQTRTFSGLAAFSGATFTLGDEDLPADQIPGTLVSSNAFAVLRTRLALGRDFVAADEQPGAEPVVVLGHSVWRDRYASDPDVIGRVVRLNAVPTTVIGVMPAGFRFPVQSDAWQPLSRQAVTARRDARTLGVFGRLADGVDETQAQAELDSITAALAAQYPDSNDGVRPTLILFTDAYVGRLSDNTQLQLIMCAVALVLVIACANAANLLLSRAVQRRREIALRRALGASRGRIVCQLLVESLLLAMVAGGLSLVLAVAGMRVFAAETADFNLPYWIHFALDARVFAFVAAVCLGTAILCGFAPAWQLSKTSALESMREGGRGSIGSARARRWTSGLMIAELALTTILLSSAALVVRTGLALRDQDTRLDPALVTARVSLPRATFPDASHRATFFAQLQQRLDANPTIARSTLASHGPFVGAQGVQVVLDTDGVAPDRPRQVGLVSTGSRYFETLGLGASRGRLFTTADGTGPPVAIVNDRFAALSFPDADPVGRQLKLGDGVTLATAPWATIVGVTPSVRQAPASGAGPIVYLPFGANPPANAVIIARGTGDLSATAGLLRQEAHAIDADVAVFNVQPIARLSEVSRWIFRAFGTMLTVFATVALGLATIGLFAVTAYGVSQRTSEIGVRTALGATRAQVTWILLKTACVQLTIGLAIGLSGAIAMGQIIRGALARTSASDPFTFLGVAALLVTTTLVAIAVPVRRAMRMDPAAALRHE